MPKNHLKIYAKPQNSRLHVNPSLKSLVVSSFQITKFAIGSTKVTVSVVKVQLSPDYVSLLKFITKLNCYTTVFLGVLKMPTTLHKRKVTNHVAED